MLNLVVHIVTTGMNYI